MEYARICVHVHYRLIWYSNRNSYTHLLAHVYVYRHGDYT